MIAAELKNETESETPPPTTPKETFRIYYLLICNNMFVVQTKKSSQNYNISCCDLGLGNESYTTCMLLDRVLSSVDFTKRRASLH